jgi:thioredoxin 1
MKGYMLVLMDFYADWCGPCKTMNPVLDALEEEYADEIEADEFAIEKVDVDEEQRVANNYQVRSLPSFVFETRDGEEETVVHRFVGKTEKQDLVDVIDEHL